LITPSFHFEILNDFLDVMNEQSRILVEILSEMSKTQDEIDIFKRLGLCALDIICGKFDEFIYITLQHSLTNNFKKINTNSRDCNGET